jgi:DNA-directed RNA polymerase specialized sigma24 family protein
VVNEPSHIPPPVTRHPSRPCARAGDWSAYVPLVRRAVARAARRYRLSRPAQADLESDAWLKLLEREPAILRRLRRARHPEAYLTRLAQNLVLDQHNAERGKWRPAASAQRHGADAVLADRLISRDRLPYDAAFEWLKCARPSMTDQQIASALCAASPRGGRHFLGLPALERVESPAPGPDEVYQLAESGLEIARVKAALRRAVQSLSDQERELVLDRYARGRRVADVGLARQLPAKPLYRRYSILLRRLRTELEAAGFDQIRIQHLLRQRHADWSRDDSCVVGALWEQRADRPRPALRA